jgi:hypothetical protein
VPILRLLVEQRAADASVARRPAIFRVAGRHLFSRVMGRVPSEAGENNESHEGFTK